MQPATRPGLVGVFINDMKLARLPYHRNSAELFSLIATEHWSVFLDSAYPYTDKGRYDILAARPYKTLVTYGEETSIDDGTEVTVSKADPFALLQTALADQAINVSGLPFCGGALGYFAYDLGRRTELLPELAKKELDVPDMAIGLYDWAVVIDHHQGGAWLVGYGKQAQTLSDWQDLLDLFHSEPPSPPQKFSVCSGVQSNMDKAMYLDAFDKIKKYIYAGDCYQVNLTRRFSVAICGDPWDVYLQLRESNPGPFSAFLRLPGYAILSSSPERFIRVVNGQVETKPVKGTIHRSPHADEDNKLTQRLLASEKDRAENLMIVDLLRNDIGKNCKTGSVCVPELFALESYATVHHLVSTVSAHLAKDKTAVDLLRGCFPGGSVTGAPKLRAMEIIEQLEPHRRHIYCGALGYIGFDGRMDTNITIRTLLYHGGRMHFWAGGGIVADSDVDAEYQECLSKIDAIVKLFTLET